MVDRVREGVVSVAVKYEDERLEPREPVFHRTHGTSGAARFPLTVVNLSPGGLMARLDPALEPGALLRVALPVVGPVEAEVRWALAGRIGCRFLRPIDPVAYPQLLASVAA
jgi:hypothetical protein